jgi:hypothetical protein
MPVEARRRREAEDWAHALFTAANDLRVNLADALAPRDAEDDGN